MALRGGKRTTVKVLYLRTGAFPPKNLEKLVNPRPIREPGRGVPRRHTALEVARVNANRDYQTRLADVSADWTRKWRTRLNGDLCISILHPPVDDPQSGELPCERWNPTQNVRTILLSVISLLNEPNTYSPANVDASVMYRRWRDSKGKDKEYENIIRKQAQAAKMEAEKEGIVVPVTLEDYCIKTHARPAEQQLDMTDFYDDEYELDDDDDDEQMSASDYEDGDDSGNGES
ncbi:Ubiquitin-conjugating enzyme subunit [Melipona bicolor]|uniref:Ubiquitin-conjugating enzyme subunit n=1 Tax=Melipona bicolor TaxID=60889 RepID=A0AA40G4L7_9HYME|nr:Ubiquitin-conjugating enzyme subunit [Melipona bicolor]